MDYRKCVGGVIRNFTVRYRQQQAQNSSTDDRDWLTGYEGPLNSINVTSLRSSTSYELTISYCNGLACITTDTPIIITTLAPLPVDWNVSFAFETTPSGSFRFSWYNYSPNPENDFSNTTAEGARTYYRLERADVSFAYPPTPLETGIRFHGHNYLNFPVSKYFPEG